MKFYKGLWKDVARDVVKGVPISLGIVLITGYAASAIIDYTPITKDQMGIILWLGLILFMGKCFYDKDHIPGRGKLGSGLEMRKRALRRRHGHHFKE